MEDQHFNKVRSHLEKELPFVIYRRPGEDHIHAFLQEEPQVYVSKNLTESGFIFAPFQDTEEILLIPEEASQKLVFPVPPALTSHEEEAQEGINLAPLDAVSREDHISLVKRGVERIKKGAMEKVVLSRKESFSLADADPVLYFKKLLALYPTAFVYLWFHPKTGCWLAATPEILLKSEGQQFTTMALAGTRKADQDPGAPWGEKEKQEQQYVTEEILHNLKPFSASIELNGPDTVQAGNLLHLRTMIRGRVKTRNLDIKELVSALHPTPAVCGLPRKIARDFIIAEEGYHREFYTGYVGELNLKKSVPRAENKRNVENLAYAMRIKTSALYVNLRCMKLSGSTATLYMGGGITRDSDPESEWEETVNKSGTLKKVLLKKSSLKSE